eukprot:TRINITY_DN4749_c0_g1_i2.p1 TRINITY_DN4749_c0_g1~~TRINITY_DN4749_c0_g1_i2.p1  ORF type:complete len:486 (+),score=96.56 TRINITY_DN4749_c0_g1_i2:30-1460(+)
MTSPLPNPHKPSMNSLLGPTETRKKTLSSPEQLFSNKRICKESPLSPRGDIVNLASSFSKLDARNIDPSSDAKSITSWKDSTQTKQSTTDFEFLTDETQLIEAHKILNTNKSDYDIKLKDLPREEDMTLKTSLNEEDEVGMKEKEFNDDCDEGSISHVFVEDPLCDQQIITDEEIARRMQEEFDAQESLLREEQLRLDEELATRLQSEQDFHRVPAPAPSSPQPGLTLGPVSSSCNSYDLIEAKSMSKLEKDDSVFPSYDYSGLSIKGRKKSRKLRQHPMSEYLDPPTIDLSSFSYQRPASSELQAPEPSEGFKWVSSIPPQHFNSHRVSDLGEGLSDNSSRFPYELNSLVGLPGGLTTVTSAFDSNGGMLGEEYLARLLEGLETSTTSEVSEELLQDVKQELKVNLLPHQTTGLAWAINREDSDTPGGILADDQGLGKTIITLALFAMQRKRVTENPDKIKGKGKKKKRGVTAPP